MKTILIFTFNRAEYSHLEPLIEFFNKSKNFNFKLGVGGYHLLRDYGNTKNLIKYNIDFEINTLINSDDNTMMSDSFGFSCIKISSILKNIKPDAVIIHGDRFDVLSVAVTAALMNICLIHIEGGERSGTINDHIRNCISKLASYHLVANINAKENLINMKEPSNLIFITGCPLYDKLLSFKPKNLMECFKENDFIICQFRPVTTN